MLRARRRTARSRLGRRPRWADRTRWRLEDKLADVLAAIDRRTDEAITDWDSWREECSLADAIVVNSEWSRQELVLSGVPREKLTVISLAYETPDVGGQKSAVGAVRSYPDRFTRERPMRVLFLGQVNLRKGVARLLEAAKILRDAPVEFWMVGPVQISNAEALADNARVKWFGVATRKQAAEKLHKC